jgi:L-2-hydroxyglutarate oxidase LhgO
MERVDVAIIGAGAVGLAVAAKAASEKRSVAVFEKHSRHGVETSSRNSEVVHAGIYYPPNSLKSRLCHAGRRWFYDHAEKWQIYIRKTGKLIVAVNAEEEARLDSILENARAAGAENLTRLSAQEANSRVPGLTAHAALWSPETGILDSEDWMSACKVRAEAGGAALLFGTAVTAIEQTEQGYILQLSANERVLARRVVNAAGLHGDRISEMAGLDVDALGCRIHWCKGHYFRWRNAPKIPHLLYPLPSRDGLGIHITLDRSGGVRLGPDTEFVDTIDYTIAETLKEPFAASVARYLPAIRPADLMPDTAGIRPKLSGPGEAHRDFVIAERSPQGFPGWIDCLGIESPGLTASPAIAELVLSMLE